MHCKLPSTKIPKRSQRASASSIELAENIKTSLRYMLSTKKMKEYPKLICAKTIDKGVEIKLKLWLTVVLLCGVYVGK